MDLQAERDWIASEIMKVRDPELIIAFKSMLKYRAKHVEKDWWDEISDAERESIERGISEADSGNLIPHEQVMKEVKAKYNID